MRDIINTDVVKELRITSKYVLYLGLNPSSNIGFISNITGVIICNPIMIAMNNFKNQLLIWLQWNLQNRISSTFRIEYVLYIHKFKIDEIEKKQE